MNIFFYPEEGNEENEKEGVPEEGKRKEEREKWSDFNVGAFFLSIQKLTFSTHFEKNVEIFHMWDAL